MNSRLFAVYPLLTCALIGCGEPIPAGNGDVAPAAAPKVDVASEPIVASKVQEYFYNPAGKRDPFKPFYDTQRTTTQAIDPNSPPLQRWDVDKFVLSGVIWNTNIPRALMVDPEGIGHVVQMGSYVGRNWGKVTSISDEAVVVTEEYQTIDGELVVNPVTVHFPGSTDKK